MVNGIESNIPTAPNSHPQNSNDKNTTKVDNPKPLPITLGSIIEPTIIFTAI